MNWHPSYKEAMPKLSFLSYRPPCRLCAERTVGRCNCWLKPKQKPDSCRRVRVLTTEEQHDDLSSKDPEEHAQRIYSGVAHSRSFLGARGIGVGQCWWIGVGTGDHTHDREIVELISQSCDSTNDEDWHHGDDKSGVDIFQSVSSYYRLPESGALSRKRTSPISRSIMLAEVVV